jgi:hypothetical protein
MGLFRRSLGGPLTYSRIKKMTTVMLSEHFSLQELTLLPDCARRVEHAGSAELAHLKGLPMC